MAIPELASGHIVAGRYTVSTPLGRGPWCATFQGLTAPNREVAIKVYDPALDKAALEVLHRACALVGTLPQELVVPVLEMGIDADSQAPVQVSELSHHPSLASLVELCPLTATEAAAVLDGIARALDVAHAHKLVHGALKPTNVFVGPAPERAVRLCDFGAPGPRPSEWGAPEEERGQGGVAADLYSAALLAFFALTGGSVFRAASPKGLDVAGLRAEALSPTPATLRARELKIELPASLDAFFAKALRPSPTERYASAVELARALRAAVGLPPGMYDRATASAPLASLPPIAPAVGNPASSTLAPPASTRAVSTHAPPPNLAAPSTLSPPAGPALLAPALAPPRLPTFGPDDAAPVAQAQAHAQLVTLAPAQPQAPTPALAPAALFAAPPRTPSKGPMVAAFAGGALAIGALGFWLVSRRTPDAADVSSARASASSAPPALTVASSATSEAAPPATAPAPTATATSKSSAGEPPSTSALQDDGKGDAELRVRCIPRCAAIRVGTHIIADGAPLRLPPGKHTILAVKQRYHSQQKHVDLAPGATETLELRLIRK